MNEYKFTDRNKKQCGYMRIVDEADTDSAELYFYGDICGSQWESMYFEEDKAPQDIADFLHSLDGKKKVDVYINSGGGDVFGGMAIYNILSRYQGETVAHIDGIAASIAGIIPFACDKVVAKSSAQIMLHKPWALCMGNADETWLTCGEAQQYFDIEIEQGEPVKACISGFFDKYRNKPETVSNQKQKLQLELDLFKLKNNIK